MPGTRGPSAKRYGRLVVSQIAALTLVFTSGWYLSRIHDVLSRDTSPAACVSAGQLLTTLGHDARLAVASVCFFFIGGLLAHFDVPSAVETAPQKTAENLLVKHSAPASNDMVRSTIVVQAALVLFLLVGVGLLGYETWAVNSSHGEPPAYWPITWYVRCAAALDRNVSLVIASLVSFLVGHWLWYRPARRQ